MIAPFSLRSKLRDYVRWVGTRSSIGHSLVARLWNNYEAAVFNMSCWCNLRQYGNEPAPIFPYELYDLDPQLVTEHSGMNHDFLRDSGRIRAGDWDLETGRTISTGCRYKSFVQHFEEGVPWEETKFYQLKVEKIKSDRSAKYPTVEELEQKCSQLNRLYQELRDQGYQTQRELAEKGEGLPKYPGDGGVGFLSTNPKYLARHEINIDIGRNGQPLLNEGRHRLCLAQILNLEPIPMRIVVRHREWQNIRNVIWRRFHEDMPQERDEADRIIKEILEKGGPSIVLGIEHPDLQILNDCYFDMS